MNSLPLLKIENPLKAIIMSATRRRPPVFRLSLILMTFSSAVADEHEEILGCDPMKNEKCKFIQCGYNARWTAWIPYQQKYTNFACCADRIYDMRKSVCQQGFLVKVIGNYRAFNER